MKVTVTSKTLVLALVGSLISGFLSSLAWGVPEILFDALARELVQRGFVMETCIAGAFLWTFIVGWGMWLAFRGPWYEEDGSP